MVTKKIKFYIYHGQATQLIRGNVEVLNLTPIMLVGKNKRKSEIIKQFKEQCQEGATIYITKEEVEERTFECSTKQFLSIANEKLENDPSEVEEIEDMEELV